MDMPPVSTTSVSGRESAQGSMSTLPRTAVTGAICASASRISGAPMSPAWRMRWDPRRARIASGRRRPCVSEITPRSTDFAVIGLLISSSWALLDGRGGRSSVIRHKAGVERSQTSPTLLRLYCQKNARRKNSRRWSKLGGSAATLLGIPRISPQAGECHPQSAGGARYLCGDADWRRKVAVLPASGGDFREDGGGGFSTDRADAGPGGATGADGHSSGGHQ